MHAYRPIALAEEATIGAVNLRGAAESTAVTAQRGRHMNLIHRVALEHVILSDQTLGAFGEKHLVAELDRRAHLAPLDQVGVRLEDRINLLRRGHLFAIEHAAAGLVDNARAETAIMRDLVAQALDLQSSQRLLAANPGSVIKRLPRSRHHFLGNADQRPISRSLPRFFALDAAASSCAVSRTCAGAQHASDCESRRCAAAPAPWQADRQAA